MSVITHLGCVLLAISLPRQVRLGDGGFIRQGRVRSQDLIETAIASRHRRLKRLVVKERAPEGYKLLLIPAGRKIDSSINGRPAGILLISRAAGTPTLRAYRSADNADRY
jgi:hypothetical protein